MATFKEFLDSDLGVFFNIDEMAKTHNINGEELEVIVDDEGLMESKIKYGDTFQVDLLFYVKKTDIDEPMIDEHIDFDNGTYLVKDVGNEDGMYKILAQQVRL